MDTIQNETYHTVITSERGKFELRLKEVWQYRDLILLFTIRSFQLTYKQTILGPIWVFLTPLITSIIYTLVFGRIAGIETDGMPKMLFYLCNQAIWIFFSACITRNATIFTANAGVFSKVYFPRLTTPISNVLSTFIQFGVQMVMVAIFLIYYLYKGRVEPNYLTWLLIPFILLHLSIMGMGIGIIISSLTTKYRDLAILVGFGVQLWMYATPIVYPMSQVSDGMFKTVLLMNPVSAPVELFRYALLGHGNVDIFYLTISWIFTIVVGFLGIITFNKVEKNFVDTV